MGAVDPNAVLRLSGRLSIGPTDMSAVWPFGGTGLGRVGAGVARPNMRIGRVLGEAGETTAKIYAGEEWELSIVLQQWDADALSTVFPNTYTGYSSESVLTDPTQGGTRFGEPLGSVVLLFTPDDAAQPVLVFFAAIPEVETASELAMNLQDQLGFPTLWTATPDTIGRAWGFGSRDSVAAALRIDGPNTSSFDFTTISGLVGWWDASDLASLTHDVGGVSAWANRVSTPSPPNVAQTTDAEKPAFVAGAAAGRPGVSFDGDDRLATTSAAPVTGNPVTIALVVQPTAVGSGVQGEIFSLHDGTASNRYRIWHSFVSGTDRVRFQVVGGGVEKVFERVVALSTTSPNLILATVDTAGGTVTLEVNGGSGSQISSTGSPTPAVDETEIGDHLNGSLEFAGYVLDALVWSSVLASGDLTTVRTEMTAKWGTP